MDVYTCMVSSLVTPRCGATHTRLQKKNWSGQSASTFASKRKSKLLAIDCIHFLLTHAGWSSMRTTLLWHTHTICIQTFPDTHIPRYLCGHVVTRTCALPSLGSSLNALCLTLLAAFNEDRSVQRCGNGSTRQCLGVCMQSSLPSVVIASALTIWCYADVMPMKWTSVEH